VKEKNPKMYITLLANGTQVSAIVPDFQAGDLSGLAYDSILDIVWAVSDIEEQ
jgi:hypothetical protein